MTSSRWEGTVQALRDQLRESERGWRLRIPHGAIVDYTHSGTDYSPEALALVPGALPSDLTFPALPERSIYQHGVACLLRDDVRAIQLCSHGPDHLKTTVRTKRRRAKVLTADAVWSIAEHNVVFRGFGACAATKSLFTTYAEATTEQRDLWAATTERGSRRGQSVPALLALQKSGVWEQDSHTHKTVRALLPPAGGEPADTATLAALLGAVQSATLGAP